MTQTFEHAGVAQRLSKMPTLHLAPIDDPAEAARLLYWWLLEAAEIYGRGKPLLRHCQDAESAFKPRWQVDWEDGPLEWGMAVSGGEDYGDGRGASLFYGLHYSRPQVDAGPFVRLGNTHWYLETWGGNDVLFTPTAVRAKCDICRQEWEMPNTSYAWDFSGREIVCPLCSKAKADYERFRKNTQPQENRNANSR